MGHKKRNKKLELYNRVRAPIRIIPLLEELISWYEKNKNKLPPLILSAVVHNQFENIHPFEDGNGRAGRILLNNILIKNGLPQ